MERAIGSVVHCTADVLVNRSVLDVSDARRRSIFKVSKNSLAALGYT